MSIFIESDSALAHMFNACTTEQINEFIPEKRSLRIHGQSTTLRLERAFWNVLDEIAHDHRVHFHVADGGIVCTACSLRLDGLVPVELGTLRSLAAGLASPVEQVDRITLSPRMLAQAARLVFRFQRFHVGVELRSERFLDEVLPVAPSGVPAVAS